jgi:ligand-binding sensor domain-containing protein
MKYKPFAIFVVFLLMNKVALCQSDSAFSIAGEPYIYTDWQSFTTESTQGKLINDHIFFLKADGDSLWIGTEGGLILYYNGEWRSWNEENGLPWNVVMGIAKDNKTGELWLALFGDGIARFSGGHFEHFTQMNSGLLNDVVYGVDIEGENVWAATTAGISRYNQISGQWDAFTERHAPMEEIWCYNVDAAEDKVYFAVWGGGILEWDVKNQDWTEYLDPDGEMEIDLYRDDGLIHVITTSASYIEGVLWASTYFGLSRYDGRNWRGYMDHDSGLPSNFINLAVGGSATSCYNCTDKGLGVLIDYQTDTWVTYKRRNDNDKFWNAHVMAGAKEIKIVPTNLELPNHFTISVAFMGDDIWIGTGHGLARGLGRGYYSGLKKSQSNP